MLFKNTSKKDHAHMRLWTRLYGTIVQTFIVLFVSFSSIQSICIVGYKIPF